MIQTAMLVALGFLIATLLALAVAGPFWRRAVRLTTRRLQATMPMSIADIEADKDELRAEYAVRLCSLEQAYERERDKAARYLVDRNKHAAAIAALKREAETLSQALEERTNETRVLEQTIQSRIPELESQLDRAGQIIAARDRELARLKTAYENQTEALAIAKKSARSYLEEVERLREVLEGGSAKGGALRKDANEALVEENHELHAEVSRLRMELARLKDFALAENAALREELHKLASQMMDAHKPDAQPAAPAQKESGSEAPGKAAETGSPGEPAQPAQGDGKADAAAMVLKEAADGKAPARRRKGAGSRKRAATSSLAERLRRVATREKA
ncbi:MAG: hypothetical protein Kow0032_24320 [Methyloligellaceae bacterium]